MSVTNEWWYRGLGPYDEQSDPWIAQGLNSSANKVHAYCQVIMNGIDITNQLLPFLISVVVKDATGVKICDLEVDDRDGRVPLPPFGSTIIVRIGWSNNPAGALPPKGSSVTLPPGSPEPPNAGPQLGGNVIPLGTVRLFSGFTFDVEYGHGRKEGGRRFWVHARGDIMTSHVKSPMQDNDGKGKPAGQMYGPQVSFGSWITQAARKHESTISVHPKFAAMTRDYWEQPMVNFNDLVQGYAQELGAVWQVRNGNHFEFTLAGERADPDADGVQAVPASTLVASENIKGLNIPGVSSEATGSQVLTSPTVSVAVGQNLISLRVRPYASRDMYRSFRQLYYDVPETIWKSVWVTGEQPFPFSLGHATNTPASPAPDAIVAEQQAEGLARTSQYQTSFGRIIFDGDPNAAWMGKIWLQGVKPGVDGLYTIWNAEHHWSRQGYITACDVINFGLDFTGQERVSTSDRSKLIQPPNTPGTPDQTSILPQQASPSDVNQANNPPPFIDPLSGAIFSTPPATTSK
jgi:hypothetical protein